MRAVDVSPAKSSRRPPSRIRIRISSGASGAGDEDGRPERARAGVDLRLRQVERVGALDVARGDVVADRDAGDVAALAEHEPDLRLGHGPGRVGADADRRARADRAPAGRVLEEELGPVGVVDERVDVLAALSSIAGVAAALVRDARAPDLGRLEREQQLVRRPAASSRLGVERLDRAAAAPLTTTPSVDDAALDAVRARGRRTRPHQ